MNRSVPKKQTNEIESLKKIIEWILYSGEDSQPDVWAAVFPYCNVLGLEMLSAVFELYTERTSAIEIKVPISLLTCSTVPRI